MLAATDSQPHRGLQCSIRHETITTPRTCCSIPRPSPSPRCLALSTAGWEDLAVLLALQFANAIIGFRYDTTELAQSLTEVLAYGTAVYAERE